MLMIAWPVSSRQPPRALAWRTSGAMSYESSSAPSEVTLPPFGLRIIRAMQPSAARGETAECVAKRKPAPRRSNSLRVLAAVRWLS